MRDQLYINGEWVSPDLGGYLEVIDPATEQPLQRVAAGTEEDVDHAVRAARRAFDNDWSQTSGTERAQWLEALADELCEAPSLNCAPFNRVPQGSSGSCWHDEVRCPSPRPLAERSGAIP